MVAQKVSDVMTNILLNQNSFSQVMGHEGSSNERLRVGVRDLLSAKLTPRDKTSRSTSSAFNSDPRLIWRWRSEGARCGFSSFRATQDLLFSRCVRWRCGRICPTPDWGLTFPPICRVWMKWKSVWSSGTQASSGDHQDIYHAMCAKNSMNTTSVATAQIFHFRSVSLPCHLSFVCSGVR